MFNNSVAVVHALFVHCKEISIYAFPDKELLGFRINFHIHVPVSDQYFPTIGLPILLQQNRWTEGENI
jgi:hypothetical protein